MKKTNKLLPVALLLLTSCATQSPMVNRDMASEGDCRELVNNLIGNILAPQNDIKKFDAIIADDAIVEDSVAEDIYTNFGRLSKKPREVQDAYRAFKSGNMSLSVLKKLSNEYPDLQGSVSAVIYKDVLKSIHLEAGNQLPFDGKKIIDAGFKDFEKTFTYRLETDDYYIIDIPVKDPTDITFLGEFGEISTINPLIFAKDGPVPTNRFFRVPYSVILELNKKVKIKVKKDIDVRYALLGYLDKKRMTYDAFKFLALDYDGKTPVDIIFSAYKDSIKAFQKDWQQYTKKVDTRSPEEVMKEGMEEMYELKGMYTQMPSTADSVVYKITITSPEDLKKVNELYTLAVNGRISLPQK